MLRISIATTRQRRLAVRIALGTLVAANLVAAVLMLKPWEGSADSLRQQAASISQELKQKQFSVKRLEHVVENVQKARSDGDTFMASNLMSRTTLSSSLLDELDKMAHTAGIKQKEVAFTFEPVEGTDVLTRSEITANYDGAYTDLMHFLNLLDHSPRLLIVDSLAAAPQPPGQVLGITIKLVTFVREGAVEQASAQVPGGAR
jgi:Tfp pilus assembly protein PilO